MYGIRAGNNKLYHLNLITTKTLRFSSDITNCRFHSNRSFVYSSSCSSTTSRSGSVVHLYLCGSVCFLASWEFLHLQACSYFQHNIVDLPEEG
ncbi:hypothetical protein L1987_50756 [Smallanthus sonchifolius]|uniref:Uncharacterized protein n=1 Tax=Smallanthus sonchifolius TaxID=185202 RepID=A0ACB9EPH9_9ASTR|nr:hypothetical protein L1987_50756 [Smallanthus sonchifolius]